ncbi:hypothetical protein C0991_009273 [Blastosporella zonata]|nr:hypothetical protein C0991_009273 [Blastosporella zonata]
MVQLSPDLKTFFDFISSLNDFIDALRVQQALRDRQRNEAKKRDAEALRRAKEKEEDVEMSAPPIRFTKRKADTVSPSSSDSHLNLIHDLLLHLSLDVATLKSAQEDAPLAKKLKYSPTLATYVPGSTNVIDFGNQVDSLLKARPTPSMSELKDIKQSIASALTVEYFKLDMAHQTLQMLLERQDAVNSALLLQDVAKTGVKLQNLQVSGAEKGKVTEAITDDSDKVAVSSTSSKVIDDVAIAIEETI